MNDLLALTIAKVLVLTAAFLGMFSLISELINGTLPL